MGIEQILANPNIEIFEIPIHSPEWYDFRFSGIGASEIGYVLRKSDWKDSLPVYEEKVGLKQIGFMRNEQMVMGSYMEQHIADMWQYHEPGGEDYWQNITAGKKFRSCITEPIKHKYFRNKKFPHLFCSLDGLIPTGSLTSSGDVLNYPGVLEIKNQRSFVLEKWILKIPPEQLYQIHQIMLILESSYGEIATLVDGCHLRITPVPLVPELAEDLLTESYKFWHQNVLPAKGLKKQIEEAYFNHNTQRAAELEAELFDYEPPPIGRRGYLEYLSENAKIEPSEIVTNSKVYDSAMTMKNIDLIKKELDLFKSQEEAFIRHHFRVKDGNIMDFGEFGTIRLKKREGSDKASLYNYVKDSVSKQEHITAAKQQVEQLQFKY